VSAHSGHRDNPVDVVAPNDLDRAVSRVWHPTEAQAAAGNYKMAHAILGGCLPVTIETPLDRFRTGTGKDGIPWKVRMPAHYGYVKGTTGADGDAVDVYVGPEAHRVHVLPVWIVDQCDADSKEYDEAKVMLGFKDSRAARRTYLSAFSDGRGVDRIGGVFRTTFEGFRRWLASGNTKKSVALTNKSASVRDIGTSYVSPMRAYAGSCTCDSLPGGFMTDPVPVAKPAPSPTWFGRASAVFAKGLASLSPKERLEFMGDAAVQASAAISKADEFLTVGDDHDRIEMVEDQWDGPPDDHAETVRAHGPGSSTASGKVPVGPNQAASGNGAEKMEREYSRPTTQTGVQRATEELGEALMGIRSMKGAIRSIGAAVRAQGMQIEALKAGTAMIDLPDATAIQTMVSTAVGKALADLGKSVDKAIRKAVAKAMEDKDDEEEDDKEDESEVVKADAEEDEDDEDEEAEQEEEGSGVEIEIDNDVEDEDDDEDETGKAKQAAILRQMAKNRLKWANRRFVAAGKAMESSKPKRAARFNRMAKGNLRKAASYIDASKALRPGHAGTGTAKLSKAIAKAKGRAPKTDAENQTTWPNKSEQHKSAPVVIPPGASPGEKALAEAAAQIQKAMDGVGMLSATVGGLMTAFSNQSRGAGGGLPPAVHVALAKAGSDELTAKETEIMALADSNVITLDTMDAARDLIAKARAKAPAEVISALTARMPGVVQAILTRAA
jgi:Inorganic Pyrophosphatase